MTAEQFNQKMDALLARNPFEAFTVFLSDGRRIEVNDRWKLLYRREGVGIWVEKDIVGERFEHDEVVQFAVATTAGSLAPV